VAEQLFSKSEKPTKAVENQKEPRGREEKIKDEDFDSLGNPAGDYQVLANCSRMLTFRVGLLYLAHGATLLVQHGQGFL
jgi:hypothetical protein